MCRRCRRNTWALDIADWWWRVRRRTGDALERWVRRRIDRHHN